MANNWNFVACSRCRPLDWDEMDMAYRPGSSGVPCRILKADKNARKSIILYVK